MKLDAPASQAPAEPISEPANDAGFDDLDTTENPVEEPTDDKPFDDEPFDAGVEADEETDPKKFIEQLTGKLGQSLRKYNEEQGQPDFELEKFAINSLLSATHTSEMDEEDKNDIIKKVNTAGNDSNDSNDSDMGSDDSGSDNSNDSNDGDNSGDDFNSELGDTENPEDLEEFQIYENENLFLNEPKKNNMFQPGSNDKLNEVKPCWKGYKQVGMKEKDGKEVPNCVPVSKMVSENLIISEKNSIFDKNYVVSKLHETFNQDDVMNNSEPETAPMPVTTPTKPIEQPSISPSRRNKPFLPMPESQPDPKAEK